MTRKERINALEWGQTIRKRIPAWGKPEYLHDAICLAFCEEGRLIERDEETNEFVIRCPKGMHLSLNTQRLTSNEAVLIAEYLGGVMYRKPLNTTQKPLFAKWDYAQGQLYECHPNGDRIEAAQSTITLHIPGDEFRTEMDVPFLVPVSLNGLSLWSIPSLGLVSRPEIIKAYT